ncbi:MAG: hypothetical protein KAJ12_00460 [Bacteroidetes bacterium]|nr:hypothetical protein [Bacteroidota bacterium]
MSSSIRSVVEQMAAEEIDPAAFGGGLSQKYSTSLVKVDEEGGIQCYIVLDPFDRERIDSLQTYSVRIEREEGTLQLVQAWVPYDAMRLISELPFVSRVQPPDYPAPR